jgi:hypothetical protein
MQMAMHARAVSSSAATRRAGQKAVVGGSSSRQIHRIAATPPEQPAPSRLAEESEFKAFLSGLGLQPQQVQRLVAEQRAAVPSERANIWPSAWEAGRTLAYLREVTGMNAADVQRRIVACYPGLLMLSAEELSEV